MITFIVRKTGNVSQRETGVQNFLHISYQANYPCTGKATCTAKNGDHYDTVQPGDWAYGAVKTAQKQREVWHSKRGSACFDIDIDTGKLSRADHARACELFEEFGAMPSRGYDAVYIEAEREYAQNLLEELAPPV